MNKKATQTSMLILVLAGCLVLVNVLGVRFFARADLTRDGLFSLSKATKDTMGALEEPVVVTAYFTEHLPAPYSGNAAYVRDLLEEYRAASKGKVAFEFVDPQSQETDADKEAKKEVKRDIFGNRFREQTSVEKELMNDGIQPVEIRVIEEDQQQTKRAYMALVIKHQEKKEVIPLIQNVASLEYDLTTLIRKMTRTKTPVIGILQGHGEPKLEEKYRYLHTMISQMYELRPVELSGKERFEGIDALWVMGPKTALAPNELKAIDQLLMEGKGVGFFLDTVQVDLKTFAPTEAQHGLSALLSTYGITLGEKLVADVKSGSVNVSERRGFMVINQPKPYPFLPVVQRMEGESVVSQGLADVLLPFVTSLEVKQAEGTTAVVLARSTKTSWLENKPPNISPQRDWSAENVTPTGPYPLMAQVSGTLKSHFASEATQSAVPGAPPLIAQSKSEARLVVAGTSHLFQDDFMQNRGNQVLALNIADWMMLDPALLSMRNRGLSLASIESDMPTWKRAIAKHGNLWGLPLVLVLIGVARYLIREGRRSTITL